MENMTAESQPTSISVGLENLYPALFQCFAIIFCGYIAGYQNIITSSEAKGLNTFVGKFSLPALIFLSLAELDLKSVNYMFLLAVLIAKGIVFFSVIIITLLISRPVNPGRSGLFAIFCTQSNDFAIGYPIVLALYQNTHPEYASYLYLMAPISLVILNPLGFILMEISKYRNSDSSIQESTQPPSTLYMAVSVAKNIALNPIVFMTVFGIIGNLIFSHELPTAISGLLKVVGSAFSATALFLLGMRMVGKIGSLKGPDLLIPGILIAVKLLVLPLVIREAVSMFHSGSNSTDTVELSTYGFLYGTFPSAPGVFMFATQYNLEVDLIAASMVVCTFLSAPLMFISAKMIAINKMKPCEYLLELDSFIFDVSIAGIVICIWLLATFVLTKRHKKIPQKATCCLVLSQLIACIGAILWYLLDRSRAWTLYLQFSVYAIGIYSARFWSAFLAITLYFSECRSLCFVLKLQPYFIVIGWGFPLVVVSILMICATPDILSLEKRNPNFQYGEAQAMLSLLILIFCLLVTVVCLVLHQRHRLRHAHYLILVQDLSNQETNDDIVDESKEYNQKAITTNIPDPESFNDRKEGCSSNGHIVEIEELGTTPLAGELCSSRFSCSSSTRDQCRNHVTKYLQQEEQSVDEEIDRQTLRHVVLLILLSCSMFVGIALSIWTLIMEEMSGIYVELSFLDASLNFGQSIFVFAVFGFDPKSVILPLVKWWRKVRHGSAAITLPKWDELDFETQHVCDLFITHHLNSCKRSIAKNRRLGLTFYRDVFHGSALVDWLLDSELVRDRPQAVEYATHLLDGRVIRHVENLYHFHDRTLFYTFSSVQDN